MSKAWTDKQLKTMEKFKAAINEACEAFDAMADFVGQFQALIEKQKKELKP